MRIWLLILIGVLPALALASRYSRAESPEKPVLDPDLPYQAKRFNPVTYDVDYSVVVTAPSHTKRLKVWLPLPQTDAGQEVTEGDLSTFPAEVKPRIATEPLFGNRFAYFEFDRPEGAQIIRHRFQIKVWELRWGVDPAKVTEVTRWPKGFDRHLRSDQSLVLNDPLRKLAEKIVPERQGEARDLAAVMGWVGDTMTYDHANASLRASSEHALKNKRGHCSDYHGLCAAFGRALGYPTRITYGINPFPKNSPSHCKLEAFLPPCGWVSFDVSETQNLIAAIRKAPDLDADKKERLARAAKERLARGFRDNTWYVQTRGTDYDLAPPASQRVAVVRTIYAEADGVALPDPDPANAERREFAWMTVHKYVADKVVTYPFKDWKDLDDSR
jgi:transglutaminase-like putative cysteine protease